MLIHSQHYTIQSVQCIQLVLYISYSMYIHIHNVVEVLLTLTFTHCTLRYSAVWVDIYRLTVCTYVPLVFVALFIVFCHEKVCVCVCV